VSDDRSLHPALSADTLIPYRPEEFNKKMIKKYLLVLFLVVSGTIAQAQSWQDTVSLIENIFSRYNAGDPGCQLAISRNGKLVFSCAWGIADMEHNVPLTTASITLKRAGERRF
jgi:CubicO group peptidase (beta-lactamase class C family)